MERYPTRDQCIAVINAELEAFIERGHCISRRYGEIVYEDSLKAFLVQHVLEQVDWNCGVWHVASRLSGVLDTLLEQALCAIERHLRDSTTIALQNGVPYNAFLYTFRLDSVDAELCGPLSSVLDTEWNGRRLAFYNRYECDVVEAVGLRQKETVVALNVLQPLSPETRNLAKETFCPNCGHNLKKPQEGADM